MSSAPSPWPSLRQRSRTLISEVYAEAITEVVSVAQRTLPETVPGPPPFAARLGNILLSFVAVIVSLVGQVERLLNGGSTGGLPVKSVREASLRELEGGAGRLQDKRLLPSAYEVWVGPRAEGDLRLRYTYDAAKLSSKLPAREQASCVCKPLSLDDETVKWVTSHVTNPCPSTRLAVWRALKRRLYHYDAGVIAFRNFPRNYLLSAAQWRELLDRPPASARGSSSASGIALDIGAGDGSLNEPMRALFHRVVATELTTPLVMRLRAVGLDGMLAEEPRPEWLGGEGRFDAVLILNVLDRCKDPFRMLEQARAMLPPDGRLVVSVVLPASQSDAAASVGGSQRRWDVSGADFETAAASLVTNVLVPTGFSPLRIVRAPYFCAGDRFSPVAALDACVIVLKPSAAAPVEVGGSATGVSDSLDSPGAEPPPLQPCRDCD